MSEPDESTGVFCLPSGLSGDVPLMELAKETFGDRCVVCRLGYDLEANREALGPEFVRRVDEDREQAEAIRGGLAEGEIAAWERSKAWAVDLRTQLEERGYTFYPESVEFIAFGENWNGCVATHPIHMGRAWGLAEPIFRRFDLINPDHSPILMRSKAVEQNLPMPEGIRLYIYRTDGGRLLAEYWEGMRGLDEMAHVATVDFPPGTVRLIDLLGEPMDDRVRGKAEVGVGCGWHTPYQSDLIEAGPDLTLEDFREVLMAGRVSEREPGYVAEKDAVEY